VTLHHLLSHQSGLPDLMDRPDWSKLRWRDWTLAGLTLDSAAQPLEFQPGERAGYSNAAYNLLGHVVERASGRPFTEHLRIALLDPLGLKNTGWDDGSVPLATGYAATAEGWARGARRAPRSCSLPARSIRRSTTCWPGAGAARRAGAVAARLRPDDRGADPARYGGVERGGVFQTFGYGLFIGPPGRRVIPGFGDRQFFHTGSWAGFRATAAYQPDCDLTVVVLSNNYQQGGAVLLASQRAVAEALGRPLPTEVYKAPEPAG
jgi:CubicO group peptidase (beta-lactamase class C family)